MGLFDGRRGGSRGNAPVSGRWKPTLVSGRQPTTLASRPPIPINPGVPAPVTPDKYGMTRDAGGFYTTTGGGRRAHFDPWTASRTRHEREGTLREDQIDKLEGRAELDSARRDAARARIMGHSDPLAEEHAAQREDAAAAAERNTVASNAGRLAERDRQDELMRYAAETSEDRRRYDNTEKRRNSLLHYLRGLLG